MKYILVAIALALSTGCASVVNGSDQTTNINTIGQEGSDRDVVCRVSNCKGTFTTQPNTTVSIKRAACDLQIHCEDEVTGETGNATLESEYKARFLLPNILIDYCIFSCPIDLLTGSVFKYPESVTVDMDHEG
jgi:hypothetical protein